MAIHWDWWCTLQPARVGEQSHGGMHTETHRGSNAAAQRVCIYLTETSRGKAWIDPEEEEDA